MKEAEASLLLSSLGCRKRHNFADILLCGVAHSPTYHHVVIWLHNGVCRLWLLFDEWQANICHFLWRARFTGCLRWLYRLPHNNAWLYPTLNRLAYSRAMWQEIIYGLREGLHEGDCCVISFKQTASMRAKAFTKYLVIYSRSYRFSILIFQDLWAPISVYRLLLAVVGIRSFN